MLNLLRTLIKTSAITSLVAGCAISTPYRELATAGQPQGSNADATVVVMVTHATLNNAQRTPFDEYTRRIVAALPQQPGLIGYSVRTAPLGNEAWTLTVWADSRSLMQFVQSELHQRAVKASAESLVGTRFGRFDIAASRLPLTWEQALKMLDEAPDSYRRKER